MIVASALLAGARFLYTEDLRHRQVIERLAVVEAVRHLSSGFGLNPRRRR